MKTLLQLLVITLLLTMPQANAASFLIQLKNGGELSTNRYWEDTDHIMFYGYGGTVGILKSLVKGIKESNVPSSDDVVTQDNVPVKGTMTGQANSGRATVLSPEVAQSPPPEVRQTRNPDNKKVDFDYYRKKKLELKDEVDKAATRYSEATTAKDLEAKEKARLEMLEFSKQVYELADELKQKNGGVLPDWWEQL